MKAQDQNINQNWNIWSEIQGDIIRSVHHKFFTLQPADREDILAQAAIFFVQGNKPAEYPHRGQWIMFANKCLLHAADRLQRPLYGGQKDVPEGEHHESSRQTRVDLDAIAELAPPAGDEEMELVQEIEQVSPRAALIIRAMRAGYTRLEIAQKMGVTPAQINHDLMAAANKALGRKNQMNLFVIAPHDLRMESRNTAKTGRPTAAASRSSQPNTQLSLFAA